MSFPGNTIRGTASTNQVGITLHEYTAPANEVLTDGSHGPLGQPSRGFIISDVGGGVMVVDTPMEAGKTITTTNLEGSYIPCAINKLVSGATVKVLVFW